MKEDMPPVTLTRLKILLADDDQDDRTFFKRVVNALAVPALLHVVENGEELMDYLFSNTHDLPDVLFLDLNMPKKNGAECLKEIKANRKLKDLPVVIYSTALPDGSEDCLYEVGAHYYARKTDLPGTQQIVHFIIRQLRENKLPRSIKEKFVLTPKMYNQKYLN